MRVSSLSFTKNMLLNFNRNQVQLADLQNKISNQSRLLKPSDDPIASTQLAKLRREQAAIDQYKTNIDRLKGNLQFQETGISSIEKQLLEIQDKLVEAMGGTLSKEDMAGYGKEIATMLETMAALMNTKDEDGHYLYAGTKTNQQPVVFDPDTNTFSYNGNRDTATTTVSNGLSVPVTTHLAQAFGDNLETLNQLKALTDKMQDTTQDLADYRDEMGSVLDSVKQSHGKVTAIYTELGGRYSNLALLKDIHDDNTLVNDSVVRGLTELDMGKASIELMSYINATTAAQKSYVQIQQLSLFSLL